MGFLRARWMYLLGLYFVQYLYIQGTGSETEEVTKKSVRFWNAARV
jgi:hypothetical protein